MVRDMEEDKTTLDILFEKFEKSLPKHLQPHAFKLVFGAIVAGVLALIGWAYGLNVLLGFLGFVAILSLWCYSTLDILKVVIYRKA